MPSSSYSLPITMLAPIPSRAVSALSTCSIVRPGDSRSRPLWLTRWYRMAYFDGSPRASSVRSNARRSLPSIMSLVAVIWCIETLRSNPRLGVACSYSYIQLPARAFMTSVHALPMFSLL